MKAVLISIQPKWCELIANDKKTVEVRKTKPKIDVPFKCYIYATQPKKWFRFSSFGYASDESLWLSNGKVKMSDGFEFWADETEYCCLNGKVIGEFVCDNINTVEIWNSLIQCGRCEPEYLVQDNACLSMEELANYIGEKTGYAWHISNLVIYDKPKELGEFVVPSKIGCCNEGKCRGCKYLDRGNGFNVEDDCNAKFCTDEYKPLRKAPQFWCYVEELGV